MRQLLIALALLVTVSSPSFGLGLRHNDLVAVGTGEHGEGLYRIDSQTGEQQLIGAGRFRDVTVRGTHRIYATTENEVLEFDPQTGASRVIATDLLRPLVTVNRTGDVFVFEDRQLSRIDPENGSIDLVLTSAIAGASSDPLVARDLELLDADTPILLSEGIRNARNSVLAFERWTATETTLVSNADLAQLPGFNFWKDATGLGVTSDGRVLVACTGDRDCGLWAFDPKNGELREFGTEDAFGASSDPSFFVDWNGVDIAALPNGQLFISSFNKRAEILADPALSGIHPLQAGICPGCPDDFYAAVFPGGKAFSAGSWNEIQPVDGVTPIPEPSAALIFLIGISIVAFERRYTG